MVRGEVRTVEVSVDVSVDYLTYRTDLSDPDAVAHSDAINQSTHQAVAPWLCHPCRFGAFVVFLTFELKV